FNLTFFPQHMLGLLGMPRRIYTYDHHGLWEAYNLTSTIGSGILGLGVLVFLVNVARTAQVGRRVGNDPWLAATLEWYTTSPPRRPRGDRARRRGGARDGGGRPPGRGRPCVRRYARGRRADLPRGARGVRALARLRHPDEAADHVAPPRHRPGRDVRRRGRRA